MNLNLKTNAAYAAQECASLAAQAANTAGTIAAGAASAIAHGALHVTAETADFVSKSILIAGPFSSAVLLGDAYAFSQGVAPFITKCGDNSPLLFMNIVGITHYAGGISKCGPKITPEELNSFVYLQFLTGLTLAAATPIASLAFRKINQLATKLNNSF